MDEFKTILKRLQIPTFTVIYADRDGHIMHLFGGQTPARPAGNYNWAGVVPGDTLATLWTRVHPYEELPCVTDPPSGWLQNANDPPWTTTIPLALDASAFPPYMAPRSMSFRAQRSARMLSEDNSITFDELLSYKHSTRMELADRILDQLFVAARRSKSQRVKRAVSVLKAWDRCADSNSRGAVLFQAFVGQIGGSLFADQWSESDPGRTPKVLADSAKAVAALESAAIQVKLAYGSIDIAWGDVYRLQQDGIDMPANGGDSELGIFRVTSFTSTADNRYRANFGDSYVAAIEFSNPVRAMSLIGYGNSSQPGSSHRVDQMPLYSRKELRPVWRKREDIMKHLEARKVF